MNACSYFRNVTTSWHPGIISLFNQRATFCFGYYAVLISVYIFRIYMLRLHVDMKMGTQNIILVYYIQIR